MPPVFQFDVDLDDNGVLLFTLKGQFDVAAWAKIRRQAFIRLFGSVRDPSRPIVSDISEVVAPAEDWMTSTQAVFAELDEPGENQARTALVVKGSMEARFTGEFYIEINKATRNKGGEIRIFEDFDAGYAWVTEGWSPPKP